MTRRASVTQAAIARAVRAVTAHGLTVARIEIAPGGGVTVIAGPPAAPGQPLTSPAPGVTPADLDEWRARKNGHRAHQGA
jgi:hypothetical protein